MTNLSMVIFISVVNPYALIVTIPLVVLGICIRQYSLRTIRDVKRIEASSKLLVYYQKKTLPLMSDVKYHVGLATDGG